MTSNPNFPVGIYQPTEYAVVPAQTDYAFAWPYIGKEDYDGSTSPYVLVIHDTPEGVRTFPSFSMPSASSIKLDAAKDSGTLFIARTSWTNGLLVDFSSGATLSEASLDLASKQAWYLWEESIAINLDSYETNEDTAKFDFIVTFAGDDATVVIPLDDGTNTITELPGDIGVWVFINGAFVQASDYSLAINGGTGIVEVTLIDRVPATGETIEIRVAQFTALAAAIADGEVTCSKLAAGAICELAKFDLDGEGSARQVLGWDASTNFGARSLAAVDISDFDTAVNLHTLDELAVPVANVNMNSKRITNQADPTNAQDGATKAYVDDAVDTTAGSLKQQRGTFTHTTAGQKFTVEMDAAEIVYLRVVLRHVRNPHDGYADNPWGGGLIDEWLPFLGAMGNDTYVPQEYTMLIQAGSRVTHVVSMNGSILEFETTVQFSDSYDAVYDYTILHT